MNTIRTRRSDLLNAIRRDRPTGKSLLSPATPGRKIALSIAAACCLLTFNNAAHAQNPDVEWVRQITGPGPIVGHAIAIDQEENSYILDNFRDTVNIPTASGAVQFIPQKTNSTKYDLFIAKVDTGGTILWAKHIGGVGSVEGEGIALDSARNIYIAGHYIDTIDFDPGASSVLLGTVPYHIPATGGGDGGAAQDGFYENGFLLKLNDKGAYQWVRNIYGKDNAAFGVATDETGAHVYITGRFKDTVDVNQMKGTDLLITTLTGTNPTGQLAAPYDCFVAKFDSAGQYVWAKRMGSSATKEASGAEAYAITVDHNYVYTTGVFTDSADFDPGTGTSYLISTSKPAQNVFISKLDANGNYVWAKGMGGTKVGSGSRGSDITTDPFGNVLITGYFQTSANFDPVTSTPGGIASIVNSHGGPCNFIAKYDSTGSFVWVKAITGSLGVEQGLGIDADDAGSVYTIGLFTRDIDANPNHNPPYTLTSTDLENTFVSKLDRNGNFLWAKQFVNGFNRGHGLAVSPLRHVYAVGHFIASVDFNPLGNPMTFASGNARADAYLVKFACLASSDTLLEVALCGDAYKLNGKTYQKSGTYQQIYWGASGCDSVVTLQLTLNTITKPVISVQNFLLSTTPAAYKTYQWLLNGNAISGATGSTYEVKQNGDYQVVVSNEEGCIDTSDIYTVTNAGIEDVNTLAGAIKVYPNPATERIIIQSPVKVDVTLTDITGRTIKQVEQAGYININDLASGLYLLRISLRDGTLIKVEKVVKQER